MPKENVAIVVGDSAYTTWESVDIGFGAKANRSFSFVAAEPNAAIDIDWPLAPGNACSVYSSQSPILSGANLAADDLLFTGYIDDYDPELEPESHKATITGRSKGQDATDCAALHPTGCFQNKTIADIAQELDQFGIGYKAVGQLEQIPMHQLVPGSTLHQELEVLCRSQAQLLVGNVDGSVNITTAANYGRHAGALVEGVNFKKGSAKLSVRHKHSEVHVKGQARRGDGAKNLRIHQVSKDTTVTRYRPRLIVAEGDTDAQRAQKRADWHVARQSGLEVTATLVVYGWRDAAGALWDAQKLIYVQSPRLKIDQDMAIQDAKLHQGADGTYATLSLVDPQALGGKSAKGKSNKAWQTG